MKNLNQTMEIIRNEVNEVETITVDSEFTLNGKKYTAKSGWNRDLGKNVVHDLSSEDGRFYGEASEFNPFYEMTNESIINKLKELGVDWDSIKYAAI